MCVCVCISICVTVKEMKCIHVPPAVIAPPAVDGCCDRQQRLAARGKASPHPRSRLLYRFLHQIGAVSQLSPAAQHTLSDRNNRGKKHGISERRHNTKREKVQRVLKGGHLGLFDEMKSVLVIHL